MGHLMQSPCGSCGAPTYIEQPYSGMFPPTPIKTCKCPSENYTKWVMHDEDWDPSKGKSALGELY